MHAAVLKLRRAGRAATADIMQSARRTLPPPKIFVHTGVNRRLDEFDRYLLMLDSVMKTEALIE